MKLSDDCNRYALVGCSSAPSPRRYTRHIALGMQAEAATSLCGKIGLLAYITRRECVQDGPCPFLDECRDCKACQRIYQAKLKSL